MEKKRRVLLKLSGEALSGDKGFGFDEETIKGVGLQIKRALDEGIEIAIVTGGGNFWRGANTDAVERVKADQIGMLATAMNCLFVSSLFKKLGMDTVVFCSFDIAGAVKLFNFDDVEDALEAGKVVFFAGGTGHPYFTTDTGVVLRAIEMHADELLMAKSVDGVYDKDPVKYPDAVKYESVTLDEMVEKHLRVIDIAASALALDNRMPMAVFGLDGEDAIYKALKGEITGTRITAG